MVSINGLVIFGKEKPVSAILSRLGFFKEDVSKPGLILIRTGARADLKKLVAFMKKKNIKRAAVFPESKRFLTLLQSNGLKTITFESAMICIVSETVKKAASSTGIKKGKASAGILSENRSIEILKSLKGAADYLSCVYIYGKRTAAVSFAAEEFFSETGISVINSGDHSFEQCDILITDSKVGNHRGVVISLNETAGGGGKSVCGVRLEIPEALKIEEIPDCVNAELLGIKAKISKLIFAR